MAHSSQLSREWIKKLIQSQGWFVNGLAVYGPNSGALLEIEVTVIPAQMKKVQLILQEL